MIPVSFAVTCTSFPHEPSHLLTQEETRLKRAAFSVQMSLSLADQIGNGSRSISNYDYISNPAIPLFSDCPRDECVRCSGLNVNLHGKKNGGNLPNVSRF